MPLKHYFHLTIFLIISTCVFSQDSLDRKSMNQKVIEVVEKYGPSISPTYHQAVCTEMVIGVLEHLCDLTNDDKSNIRIIIYEDVYELMDNGSPLPKGVYYALTKNEMGIPIDDQKQVLPGDFVQFWYPNSWGHCGILHSIDTSTNIMKLYSSFPSTDGYGIQEFDIPSYCYFVRLKEDVKKKDKIAEIQEILKLVNFSFIGF